jgi:hypothetical protein
MREYDAVLLPISFLPEHRSIAEFNILTKMTECLASGTITLLLGPANSAMAHLLKKFGAAVILTDPCREGVEDALLAVTEPNKRSEVLNAAHRMISEEYSLSSLEQRWQAARRKIEDVDRLEPCAK